MCAPPISSTNILIPQPTRTRPPPRKPRIPLSRTCGARTPICLIILPVVFIVVVLLPRHFRSITSSRSRWRVVARPAASTGRGVEPFSATIFTGLLRENLFFLLLAAFFGCFLGFLFGLFFRCFFGLFYSVGADLFVVVWGISVFAVLID